MFFPLPLYGFNCDRLSPITSAIEILDWGSNNQWNSWRTFLLTIIQPTKGLAQWWHEHTEVIVLMDCIFKDSVCVDLCHNGMWAYNFHAYSRPISFLPLLGMVVGFKMGSNSLRPFCEFQASRWNSFFLQFNFSIVVFLSVLDRCVAALIGKQPTQSNKLIWNRLLKEKPFGVWWFDGRSLRAKLER